MNSNSINLENELRIAIRSALNCQAVIFLGAGASKSAKNINGDPLPVGQELSDIMATDCGIDKGYSLDAMTEHYVDVKGENQLIKLLNQYLTVTQITPELETLASLPWTRIWTTNYDSAIESALKKLTVTYYSLSTVDDISNAQGNRRVVIHINGILERLKNSLTSDFVLSSQSYATKNFEDSEWSVIFRNDLQRAKAFIFVGYSLADIDIARLIFNPDIYNSKIHFIDRENINPVLNAKLSKFGKVHPIGVTGLKKLIEEEKANWIAPEYVEEYQSFLKLEVKNELKTPSDDDFYDLILQGIINDGFVLSQAESPNNPIYTVVRKFESDCIKHLEQPNTIAVISGSFASGKTIAIRSIGLQLAAKGHDVFLLDYAGEIAFSEIQRLCRRENDFILIIENYSHNLELIETFCRYARPDCVLITSERSEVHELRLPALVDKIKHRDTKYYDLDILDDDEISNLSSLLSHRGLWGKRTKDSESQRKQYLKHDCNAQMQSVLIDVVKSPQVKDRLDRIVNAFQSVENGMRVLIAFCLLKSIGEEPRVNLTAELLKLSYETFKKISSNENTRQIVAVQSGIAQFRSSIIANAVLSSVSNSTSITDVISECVFYAEHGKRADSYLGYISKELIRYGTLERILPEKGKRAALQNLYEGLKNIPSLRDNPQFWLQYAMSRLALGELDVARRYFSNSYSLAEKTNGYDTYQIDNHYCRLLLLEAEQTTISDEAFKSANQALTILKKQVLRENRHYPYRSVWNLEGVVKRHSAAWTTDQKKAINGAVLYLIDVSKRLDPQTARSTSVVGGLQRLNKIVSELTSET